MVKHVVYLADEFYYMAKKPITSIQNYYDGFKYTEDGVGTSRYFYHIFNKHKNKLPESLEKTREVTIICGVIAENYLKSVVARMNEIKNLKVNLVAIENKFFGKGITVTGLLTATDIINGLSDKVIGDELIIPEVVLRKGEPIFLDDYKIEDVENALKTKVRVCPMGAEHFIDACLGK
jgi:NifB/MoaA-like Fe-S oxidoreductase